MEWTKIPTNLITGDYTDAEILAIVKYQLVYALDETEPSEKKLKRFLNKNQIKKVQSFINDIKTFVDCDIKSVTKIKNKNKRYYNKHKDLQANQKVNSAVLQDVLQDDTDKIRIDKIRNKEKEINKEKENFKVFWSNCPKQIDEYKAYTLYNTLIANKQATSDELLQGIKDYSRFVRRERTDEKYIATPFNWLSNRKWTDKYEGINYERPYNPNL